VGLRTGFCFIRHANGRQGDLAAISLLSATACAGPAPVCFRQSHRRACFVKFLVIALSPGVAPRRLTQKRPDAILFRSALESRQLFGWRNCRGKILLPVSVSLL
jgi:hypothetical protein